MKNKIYVTKTKLKVRRQNRTRDQRYQTIKNEHNQEIGITVKRYFGLVLCENREKSDTSYSTGLSRAII